VLNAGGDRAVQGRSAITVLIATLGVAPVVENVLDMIYGAANVSYSFAQGGLLRGIIGPPASTAGQPVDPR